MAVSDGADLGIRAVEVSATCELGRVTLQASGPKPRAWNELAEHHSFISRRLNKRKNIQNDFGGPNTGLLQRGGAAVSGPRDLGPAWWSCRFRTVGLRASMVELQYQDLGARGQWPRPGQSPACGSPPAQGPPSLDNITSCPLPGTQPGMQRGGRVSRGQRLDYTRVPGSSQGTRIPGPTQPPVHPTSFLS